VAIITVRSLTGAEVGALAREGIKVAEETLWIMEIEVIEENQDL
jgi:hypothetical protein